MNRSKSILAAVAVVATVLSASGCAVYEMPVAAQPAPVYYEPAPVVYAQPVYVAPQPVYVGPPPVTFGLSLGYRSGGHRHWHGRGRYRY